MASGTILVVDNDQSVLDIMRRMLARSSYDVLTASHANAALRILEQVQPVDLVVSEAVLPGMSGSELVNKVRGSFPSTAVMLMTGYTEKPLDAAIPFLAKPFTIQKLTDRVAAILAARIEAT